jgi:hypothetical protein
VSTKLGEILFTWARNSIVSTAIDRTKALTEFFEVLEVDLIEGSPADPITEDIATKKRS